MPRLSDGLFINLMWKPDDAIINKLIELGKRIGLIWVGAGEDDSFCYKMPTPPIPQDRIVRAFDGAAEMLGVAVQSIEYRREDVRKWRWALGA